jgi:hypothetical protein
MVTKVSAALALNGVTPIANGGTGGSDAASARTALGVPADSGTVHIAGGETITGAKRGTITTDNALSFDLNASNDFKCTPSALGTLTFTNIPAAPAMQTGFILLINTGGYVISAAGTTKISATSLSMIGVAGTYAMSYFTDGTNVYVNAGATV